MISTGSLVVQGKAPLASHSDSRFGATDQVRQLGDGGRDLPPLIAVSCKLPTLESDDAPSRDGMMRRRTRGEWQRTSRQDGKLFNLWAVLNMVWKRGRIAAGAEDFVRRPPVNYVKNGS